MPDYWVDDGGNNTTGTSWATAYTSIRALVAAVSNALTVSGNRIFIGHDHADAATYTAHCILAGPTSGKPVQLISCNRADTSTPPAYLKATSPQVDTFTSAGGPWSITIDGSFALYGIWFRTASTIALQPDADETHYGRDVTFGLGPNAFINWGFTGTYLLYENLHVDLTQDGAIDRTAYLFNLQSTWQALVIRGLTFTNALRRTGHIFTNGGGKLHVSDADFSGFTNATTCELIQAYYDGFVRFENCKLAATWALSDSAFQQDGSFAWMVNCAAVNTPAFLLYRDFRGQSRTRSDLARTGGATFDNDTASWQINTTTICSEAVPFVTPWIYGVLDSTGAKTFSVSISHDANPSALFTDAEVWLEVEYHADATGPRRSIASNRRAPTATAATHATDSASWSGSGPSYTHKQLLSVTATVLLAGMFRARVAVARNSVVDANFLLVDPIVVVT